mgnify:CR=1 FL=1
MKEKGKENPQNKREDTYSRADDKYIYNMLLDIFHVKKAVKTA